MPGYLDVRGSVVVAERLDDRHHRRGLAADRRLLDDLWRPAAGPHDHAALPRRAGREPRDRHARHEHRHGLLERPRRRQASASVSIDVGGIAGVGLVNGRVWHDADFDRVFDAERDRARGLDGRALSQRLARAHRAHGGRRRLPHERHRAELRDGGSLRAAVPPARRRRDDGDARPRATPSSRTICSASRTSSCCRAATCRT